MSILSAKDLTVGYRKGNSTSPVISGLNLSLSRGKLVALIGANGIGKSTLLRTLVGNQPPLEGEVSISGIRIGEISRKDLSLLLGIVNTERTQAGALTVREVVSLGRQPYTGFLGILSKNDKSIVEKAMQDAGILHKASSFLAELSDGERQKVMIAKALAQCTPIIILDEPMAFLDVASRMETMLLLHNLAHKQNKAVLLSSHDLSQSMMLADELWVVTNDQKIISGNTEDVVLSGAMDSIFASSIISFDLLQGDFCINLDSQYDIKLNCNDKILKKWIGNALKRNGYGISNDEACKNEITAISPNEITVSTAQGSIKANSISDMIAIIKGKSTNQ